ncbi:MAG TPA: radical SAM protein [Thermodesulfobacteriota bacterium]|nr:radical SAM protein [Thermodesulfobacteriota bacterium]
MKFKLIYPAWQKLQNQTEFHLPPHGPVVFAATLPPDVEIDFVDDNLEAIDFDDPVDMVGISMMLTSQVKRGWAIADTFRRKGVPVIFGGIATMLHPEETAQHADAVFLGEAEGRMEKVLDDFRKGRLQKTYDYLTDFPPIASVGTARREILKRELYNYKGIQMVDLVHASRGCRFNCYPCCVNFLGGRQFRSRPLDKVVEELASIDNNRLYIVDNSLAQDTEWEKNLFREMIPLKKKWCSHPIEDDDQVLDLAVQAGAWYVYQAVFDTSDHIRQRIKKYHDFGIAVEGTILLGLDHHTEDYIRRLIDFLLEIELDLAEFTILTPFPHTRAFDDLARDNRILSLDWDDYTCDKVVFQPKQISPERLQELYLLAWETFYREKPQTYRMFDLFKKVIMKEMVDGTFRGRPRKNLKFGRKK